jgi:menaquinone-9 beta-reductase
VANLCFVMDLATFRTLGASYAAALARLRQLVPLLDARLRAAMPVWTSAPSVAGLPYGYVCRASDWRDGFYRVGDQLAVIPSFTGEGIAIALRTARLAAEAIMAGAPSREFTLMARRQVRWPMRLAAFLEAITRRHVLARPALSFARHAGVLPILARGTRLPVRTVGSAPASRLGGLQSLL